MKAKKAVLVFLLVFLIFPSLALNNQASAASNQVNVVALGDSYTSGNGALNYENHECWRSGNAYVQQYSKRLRDVGFSVNTHNQACMGAVNADIPQQIVVSSSQLNKANVVFITIGGNDAKFVDIVRNCLSAERLVHLRSSCLEKITNVDTGQISRDTMSNLREIRKAAPDAKVVLVGYPYLIAEGCALVHDANTVRTMQQAADQTYSALVGHLNNELGKHFSYLSLLQTFEGHQVCGGNRSYVRGSLDTLPLNYSSLLSGDLVGVAEEAVAEWWHPNVEGHAKIADELLKLGVHPDFVRDVPKPNDPMYTDPAPASQAGGYRYLPFDCGTVVPYVSTYDSFNYGASTFFHGASLDMPMPAGTPVVSPHNGKAYVLNDPSGYGNYIDLHADNGYIYRMAHLQGNLGVSNGQTVLRGKVLGYVGTTGASTGPHLHFERRTFSTGQVAINLGGAALEWGGKQDNSGFRITTHSLLSQNCAGSPAPYSRDRYADILTHEFGKIRYGRSDGHDYRNWEVALDKIANPTVVVACDFDGDGWDEYLSYERQPTHPSWIMMADPKGDGKFSWTKIANVHTHNTKMTCGDWNGDGRDDVFMHNTRNQVIVGYSSGSKVSRWSIPFTGIGTPTYWDVCDINGDGREDIISYEGWANRFVVGYQRSNGTRGWQVLLPGIYKVGGFTCGNFTSFAHDEIVAWQPEQRGRYMLGRFASRYTLVNWDPLNPTGLSKPYQGEVLSGDIDGDGYDEFVVNEYRSNRRNHSVMVGDFNSARGFSWHPFIEGISPRDLAVGNFIG